MEKLHKWMSIFVKVWSQTSRGKTVWFGYRKNVPTVLVINRDHDAGLKYQIFELKDEWIIEQTS